MSKKLFTILTFFILIINLVSIVHAQGIISEPPSLSDEVRPYELGMSCTPGELRCGDGYQETPYVDWILIKCNNAGNGYEEVQSCYTCIDKPGEQARCSTTLGRFVDNSISHFYLYLIFLLLVVLYFIAVRYLITNNIIFVTAAIFYGLAINVTIIFIEALILTEPFITFFFTYIPTIIISAVLFPLLTKFKKKITYSLIHLGLLILSFIIFFLGVLSMMPKT